MIRLRGSLGRGLVCSLILFFSQTAYAGWTYFFYISGDYYFEGPTMTSKSRLELEDQAHALYELLYESADSDTQNNYAIFFDPKGRAAPFSSRHVRFRYFERGRKVHSNGIYEREIDATSPETFERFFKLAKEHIVSLPQTETLFFYYGEQISEKSVGSAQDLSHPKSEMLWDSLSQAFSSFGQKWSLQIFQSCYSNTIASLKLVAPHTRALILVNGLVTRSVLPGLETLLKSGPKPELWIQEFMKLSQQSPFPHTFFVVPKHASSWVELLDRIQSATPIHDESKYWKELTDDWRSGYKGQGLLTLDWEGLAHPVEILSSRLVYLRMSDWIDLRIRASDQILDEALLNEAHKLQSDPDSPKFRVPVVSGE
jgi:hypothetical protein